MSLDGRPLDLALQNAHTQIKEITAKVVQLTEIIERQSDLIDATNRNLRQTERMALGFLALFILLATWAVIT